MPGSEQGYSRDDSGLETFNTKSKKSESEKSVFLGAGDRRTQDESCYQLGAFSTVFRYPAEIRASLVVACH